MQSFSDCMKEYEDGGDAISPVSIVGNENAVNFGDPDNRDGANELFADITADILTPIPVIYERIRQTLIGLGYTIPSAVERSAVLTDSEGEMVFSLVYPGVVPVYLYFAFVVDEETTEVFAELVTQEDLDDILSE